MTEQTAPAQGTPFSPQASSLSARRGIEHAFDVPLVSRLALKEKQIQQNVRPVIAVHKWFARRPGTLFRGLLLAEFGQPPLSESYFRPQSLPGLRVADPFMGGGTPLVEANRLSCEVLGWDVNPMAYWVVRQEIDHLDLPAYESAALAIAQGLNQQVGQLYETTCSRCGVQAFAKYFVWIKTQTCAKCSLAVDLFPGYILAQAGRHPRDVLICPACGELSEVASLHDPGFCRACHGPLTTGGPAARNRCPCPGCGHEARFPSATNGPPRHRLVAIEYHCTRCRADHRGRFFKRPDDQDLARTEMAETALANLDLAFVPVDAIERGDETARLFRWGYSRYREMFNARQLLGLELLSRKIAQVPDTRIRNALATNLSDLLRYQNMLCRYDTKALKSLDVFSVHGFPVGLVQCESNLLGIQHPDTRINVGSGGWSNIVEKFLRAKRYCDQPFETRYVGTKKQIVPMPGEWIGDERNGGGTETRIVTLHAESATRASLAPSSLDAVLTDPPYFANVQYAELMDFCYVWLRRLLPNEPAFKAPTTRNPAELTGNVTMQRDLEHFTAGLADVYSRMARALKPGHPFVFTYHHNTLDAYYPIAVALLDSDLACTATLPCPAEMGGSIHIHRTGSSIVDTVFVCRTTGTVARRSIANSAAEIAELVLRDLELLRGGGVRPTLGDARCVAYGHLTRLAVWSLRPEWRSSATTAEKLASVDSATARIGTWEGVKQRLGEHLGRLPRLAGTVCETASSIEREVDDEVSF